MREIVLDTETTGLDPAEGHRIIEIGMIELENHRPTGRTYHAYFNPERDVPADSFAIHGLSAEFLSTHRIFAHRAIEIVDFLGHDPVVAHNAMFDVKFLNFEFERCGRLNNRIANDRIVDTLLIAGLKHGGNNTLDGLCKRYKISLAGREKHGALVDAELLAKVYLELIEARQGRLELVHKGAVAAEAVKVPQRPMPLPSRLKAEDIVAHREFIATFKEQAIWFDYLTPEEQEKAA